MLLQRSGTSPATLSANRMRIFACLSGPAPFLISRAYALHCLFRKKPIPEKTIKINYRIFFLDTVGTNCFR